MIPAPVSTGNSVHTRGYPIAIWIKWENQELAFWKKVLNWQIEANRILRNISESRPIENNRYKRIILKGGSSLLEVQGLVASWEIFY